MPGQRTIVLVSPGFLTPELQQEKTDVLDRGHPFQRESSVLWMRAASTPTALYDASRQTVSVGASLIKARYDRDADRAQADVLAEMASGTGGVFFENSNDLDEGFRRVAVAPEYYYVLGFSPQNLKLDGSFHALKVTLKPPGDLSLSARRGYYAPNTCPTKWRRPARDRGGAVLPAKRCTISSRFAHAVLQIHRTSRPHRPTGSHGCSASPVSQRRWTKPGTISRWSPACSTAMETT